MKRSAAKSRGRPRLAESDERLMRERIIDAARRLFVRDGAEAVSMRNVAAEVGCSPMALYRYFPAKQDMLSTIWATVLDALFRRLDAVQAPSPLLRLEQLALSYLDYWLANPEQFQLVFLQRDLEPGATRRFMASAGIVERYACFTRAATEAIAAGALADDDAETFSQGLIGLLHGLALNLIGLPDYRWTDPGTLARSAVRRYLGTDCGGGQDRR